MINLHNGGEDVDFGTGLASGERWPYAPQPITVQAKTSKLHSTRRGDNLENLRIRCTQIIGEAQDLDSATSSFRDV